MIIEIYVIPASVDISLHLILDRLFINIEYMELISSGTVTGRYSALRITQHRKPRWLATMSIMFIFMKIAEIQ